MARHRFDPPTLALLSRVCCAYVLTAGPHSRFRPPQFHSVKVIGEALVAHEARACAQAHACAPPKAPNAGQENSSFANVCINKWSKRREVIRKSVGAGELAHCKMKSRARRGGHFESLCRAPVKQAALLWGSRAKVKSMTMKGCGLFLLFLLTNVISDFLGAREMTSKESSAASQGRHVRTHWFIMWFLSVLGFHFKIEVKKQDWKDPNVINRSSGTNPSCRQKIIDKRCCM